MKRKRVQGSPKYTSGDLQWIKSQDDHVLFEEFGDENRVSRVQVVDGQSGWQWRELDNGDDKTKKLCHLVPGRAYLVRKQNHNLQWTYTLFCTRLRNVRFKRDSNGENTQSITLEWDKIDTSNILQAGYSVAIKYSVKISDSTSPYASTDIHHVGGKSKYLHSFGSNTSSFVHFFVVQAIMQLGRVSQPESSRVPQMISPVQVSDTHEFFSAPAPPDIFRATPNLLEMEWSKDTWIKIFAKAKHVVSDQKVVLEVGPDLTLFKGTEEGWDRPTRPDKFPAAMRQMFTFEKSPGTIALAGLVPGGWYWIRTRCSQAAEYSLDAVSDPVAVQMPRGRPAPPSDLSASYTLYNDCKRRMRHIFIRLEWRAGQGIPADEYVIQRCDNPLPDDQALHQEWETVCVTDSSACVLSGLVTLGVFHHRCRFAVRAKNDIGVSRESLLSVSIRVKESSTFSRPFSSSSSSSSSSNSASQKRAQREQLLLEKTGQLVSDYLGTSLVVVRGNSNSDCHDPELPSRIESVSIKDRPGLFTNMKPQQASSCGPKGSPRATSPRKRRLVAAHPIRIPPEAREMVRKWAQDDQRQQERQPDPANQQCVLTTSKARPNPYREPLYDHNSIEKRISKGVYKAFGLPDFSYARGVHSELAVQQRIKAGRMVWTYASNNQNRSGSAEAALRATRIANNKLAASSSLPNEMRVNLPPPPKTEWVIPPPGAVDTQDRFTDRVRCVRPGFPVCELNQENEEQDGLAYGSVASPTCRSEAISDAWASSSSSKLLGLIDSQSDESLIGTSLVNISIGTPGTKESAAATKLQATFRMHAARQEQSTKQDAAIAVQSAFRMARARSLYFVSVEQAKQEREQAAAATAIQCGFRRRKSVTMANNLRQERILVDIHATRIQSQFRALEARRRTKVLQRQQSQEREKAQQAAAEKAAVIAAARRAEEERRTAAAAVIQRRLSVHIEQKQFQQIKRAASIIQQNYRAHQHHMAEGARTTMLVVRLQTRFRGYRARKALEQRKRFQVKSIVTIDVASCGHRDANGRYETMGVSDAAQYVRSSSSSADSFIIERSLGDGGVPVWTLKRINGTSGEASLLYANRIEGASLCPPRHSWQPVVGARPPPIINWKNSTSYMDQLSMMDKSAVVVTDSGCSEVHGRYIQSGASDDVPQFTFRKSRTSVYMLLRTPYGDSKIWVLAGSLLLGDPDASLQSVEDAKDRDKAKRVYYVNMENGAEDEPPLSGWVSAQHGIDPVPLFVKQSKLNQSKHLL